MNTFEVGDVVQLKSGGPIMTVSSTEGSHLFCEWFDNGEAKNGYYPPAALQAVSEGGSKEFRTTF